jgi:hypothetical protein
MNMSADPTSNHPQGQEQVLAASCCRHKQLRERRGVKDHVRNSKTELHPASSTLVHTLASIEACVEGRQETEV